LTDAPRDFKFFRSQYFELTQEAHLQFALRVELKEFFETFLEDGVGEHICHNVESASDLEAGFHFDNSNLIESGAEDIKNDTAFLGTLSYFTIEFNSRLEMLGVFSFFLEVHVRAEFD